MGNKLPLRWGILSTARINRAIIGPIRASKNSQLLAVASRSVDKARDYAKAWEIPVYHSSYEDLLADPDIDVVYISLPNGLHAEWSMKAMRMGKHVLCEKPLTTSVEDMEAVIHTATETGMVLAEAFMYRHHPQTIQIKTMIDNGEIGKLQLIRGSFCYTNSRDDNPRLDFSLGGGSAWDVGCYPISYSRYITSMEPIEAYGHQITGPTGVDLQFAGEILFPGGVVAQFDSSFISPYRAWMEFTGEKGRLTSNNPYKPGKSEKLFLYQEGETRSIRVKGRELYQGEIEDIESAVLYGKPNRVSLEDSQANLTVILALLQSAQESRPITILHQ